MSKIYALLLESEGIAEQWRGQLLKDVKIQNGRYVGTTLIKSQRTNSKCLLDGPIEDIIVLNKKTFTFIKKLKGL